MQDGLYSSVSVKPKQWEPKGFAVSPMLGFALYLVWQNAQYAFLFPVSAGLAVSPLFTASISALILLIACFVSYRTDSAAFSPSWLISISLTAFICSTVASILVFADMLPLWGVYVAAAVIGFSCPTVALAWASVFAPLPSHRALVFACIALLVGSVLDYCSMYLGMEAIAFVMIVFASGSWLCLLFTMRGKPYAKAPVLYRPKRLNELLKLVVGITILAVGLGIVAGTTANESTPTIMGSINLNVMLAGIVVSIIIIIALMIGRQRVDTLALLKVFAPSLVAVVLLNIALMEYSGLWLALTILAWLILKLLVFLVLVGLDHRGIISLPIVFPALWSSLMGGYAVGVFLGQTVMPLASANELEAITDAIILVALLAVVATVIILTNKLIVPTDEEPAASKVPAQIPLDYATLYETAGNGVIKPEIPESEQAGYESTFGEASLSETGVEESGTSLELSETTRTNSQGGQTLASEGADSLTGTSSHESVLSAKPTKVAKPEPMQSDPETSALEDRCRELAASHKLSDRETEVLILLAKGHTRVSVAKRLFISENTVRDHVKSIYRKLYIHSRQQLIDLIDSH